MAEPAHAQEILAWFSSHAAAVMWGGTEVPQDLDPAWFAREIEMSSDVYRVATAGHGPILGVCGLRFFQLRSGFTLFALPWRRRIAGVELRAG